MADFSMSMKDLYYHGLLNTITEYFTTFAAILSNK